MQQLFVNMEARILLCLNLKIPGVGQRDYEEIQRIGNTKSIRRAVYNKIYQIASCSNPLPIRGWEGLHGNRNSRSNINGTIRYNAKLP